MTITTTSTIWFKRIAAGAILATGSALVALGGATDSFADTASTNIGPSRISAGADMNHPTPHPAFPNQHNQPVPGSSIHHHHQWNRHRG
ncbi:hypothetical protein [Mycolicibacterium sphagni]|uniref:DUF2613 domain-containing protein n=1 Tax=Mycolicibacterium sphagni TaxID=1786 RepID=A0A255DAX3_9MYCO|nr:hypothetical protein [Mycolicibacterium sphagni]MCV7180176.1 hypothetical protein [Mycolicibacterium sphagni]OYN75781.1 hypothetical protein CG716_24465 [Mycolicibacterium sphagni]